MFFHKRLHFSIYENECSETHLLGITLKVCSSLLFATSTVASDNSFIVSVKGFPVYLESTIIYFTIDNKVIASIDPFRSVIFAVVTVIACGKPKTSVITCRLMPEIFFLHHILYFQHNLYFLRFVHLRYKS